MNDDLVRGRLRFLPPIRRARLWRLYAEDGRRFLDFWMDRGSAILGAKGTGIGTAAKAGIDTGLTRPFPSILEARLERSLSRRYPGFAAVRLYRNEERARKAAAPFLAAGAELPVVMPFAAHFSGTGAPPNAPDAAAPAVAMPRVALPRLPCPSLLSPAVLLFGEAEAAASATGDIIAPLSLASAHRSLVEFERFEKVYAEPLWKRCDCRLAHFFDRRGPYLYLKAGSAEARYQDSFAAALGAGVLLSPDPCFPSIIPGDFDDGELARLAKALAALA